MLCGLKLLAITHTNLSYHNNIKKAVSYRFNIKNISIAIRIYFQILKVQYQTAEFVLM